MRKKPQLIVGLSLLAVLLLIAGAIITYPTRALYLCSDVLERLGYKETAWKIHLRGKRLAIERAVSERFDCEAVWVKLPRSYYNNAAHRMLSYDNGLNYGSYDTPLGSPDFTICVPERLEHLFTPEKLDEYERSRFGD